MRTFALNLKARAKVNKKFQIPPHMLEAYFLSRGWTYENYRKTPHYLIKQVLLLWECENIVNEPEKPSKSPSSAKKK